MGYMSMQDEPWHPYPPYEPYPPGAIPPPRKRRRVFLYVFIAVQILFLALVIIEVAGGSSAAQNCHDQYLTHAQCASASETGTAIGVVVLIFVWAAIDVILGVIYVVARASRQKSHQ